MSTEYNPYQPPTADMTEAPAPGAQANGVTPGMLEHLAATKPWVRFLSITGMIFAGLMVLLGFGMIAVGLIGELKVAGMGLLYFVLAALYVLPTLYLHRYGNAIRRTQMDRDAPSVEAALLSQKTFWKVVGIMTAVSLALYVVFIIVAVIASVVMAAAR